MPLLAAVPALVSERSPRGRLAGAKRSISRRGGSGSCSDSDQEVLTGLDGASQGERNAFGREVSDHTGRRRSKRPRWGSSQSHSQSEDPYASIRARPHRYGPSLFSQGDDGGGGGDHGLRSRVDVPMVLSRSSSIGGDAPAVDSPLDRYSSLAAETEADNSLGWVVPGTMRARLATGMGRVMHSRCGLHTCRSAGSFILIQFSVAPNCQTRLGCQPRV